MGPLALELPQINTHKLLLTAGLIAVIIVVRFAIVWIVRLSNGGHENERSVFWTRQGSALATAVLIIAGLLVIWADSTSSLATFGGLIGAGLAFALQRVITALAGYLVILRGNTFTVRDRITMGGVRGDVISLGFLQTRIMEMGEPPTAQSSDNRSWVRARQYTGRIVSVTNDKVFDQPIYNYTREFPFMWEEIKIPIGYKADRKLAEHILLECAAELTESVAKVSDPVRREMERKYFIDLEKLQPHVFYNLTDNWIELNLRFITPTHGTRYIKDEIQRLIVDRFDQAGIEIASGTYDIVGFPPLRIEGPVADRLAERLDEREREDRAARR